MVIQPAFAPALVHAIPGADPDRRRLSRTAAFAVAVSVAAHVAVGLYIYEAKYGAPPALAPADPPIVTTFAPDVTVRPKPTKAPPPPPHAAHRAALADAADRDAAHCAVHAGDRPAAGSQPAAGAGEQRRHRRPSRRSPRRPASSPRRTG